MGQLMEACRSGTFSALQACVNGLIADAWPVSPALRWQFRAFTNLKPKSVCSADWRCRWQSRLDPPAWHGPAHLPCIVVVQFI